MGTDLDSGGGGGGGGGFVGGACRVYGAAAANINALLVDNVVPWNNTTGAIGMGGTNFNMPNGTQIEVLRDGFVEVKAIVSMVSAGARYNGRAKIMVNGVAQPPRGKSGYIRAASGHNEASLTVFDTFQVFANDLIEIRVDRESAITTAVTTVAGESVLTVEYKEVV
jgi:hypothetical protein